MLDALKTILVGRSAAVPQLPAQRYDRNLAAAALMVRVIAADGVVEPEEIARMRAVLLAHYDLSEAETDELIAQARQADADAIDLYGFTSVLKSEMDEGERLHLVEDLWDMVYADGHMDRREDNVVWRVAELLGITSDKRIALKMRVKERTVNADDDPGDEGPSDEPGPAAA